MKIIVRRGLAADIPKNAEVGEVLFNVDTRELCIGLGDNPPMVITEVVEGPEGVLYHPTPLGYIPLCIRDHTPKSPYINHD